MSRIGKPHHEAGAVLAAWVATVGRQKMPAIVSHFGWQPDFASCAARAALLDKRVGKIKIDGIYWWATLADVERMREDIRQRRRDYSARFYRDGVDSGLRNTRNQPVDPDNFPDWPVERRFIKADGSPLPFVCRAPNSVFALGAA